MLQVPAPFPEVGSYAIYEGRGRSELVRIVGRPPAEAGEDPVALVSFPLTPNVASGNTRLPIAELLEGTGLTDQEREELQVLEGRILALKRPGKDLLARAARLRGRSIRANTFAALIARLPAALRNAA